jgi:DNA replication and repair protein RecF
MIVTHIRLTQFRNHLNTALEFGPQINVMLGSNGQGKTSILEAVSYLSLTKSFYAPNDATVAMIGTDGFAIEGNIVSDAGVSNVVNISYDRDSGTKNVTINKVHPETLSSVIGRFPVVVLSPENNAITFGAPADRRRFLDMVLSQVNPVYFEHIQEFRRVLRQRNRILLDARFSGLRDNSLLAPWTESLVRYGSSITERRRAFVAEFAPYVLRAYGSLVGSTEKPGVVYCPGVELGDDDTTETIANRLREELNRKRNEEYQRGSSLVGPHRDDLLFSVNGGGIRRYASQGQHKTMLIALKVAEFFYVKGQRGEQPIFLLDDVFSELDERRRASILNLVDGIGQSFISTTDEAQIRKAGGWQTGIKTFMVNNGTCTATS